MRSQVATVHAGIGTAPRSAHKGARNEAWTAPYREVDAGAKEGGCGAEGAGSVGGGEGVSAIVGWF